MQVQFWLISKRFDECWCIGNQLLTRITLLGGELVDGDGRLPIPHPEADAYNKNFAEALQRIQGPIQTFLGRCAAPAGAPTSGGGGGPACLPWRV